MSEYLGSGVNVVKGTYVIDVDSVYRNSTLGLAT